MASVISEIIEWAGSRLKYWEQLALYKIMSGAALDDQAYKDLLHHLYIDFDLLSDPKNRPDITFDAFKTADTKTKASDIQLCEIRNFENVNALVSSQRLPIGTNLTVVYGANGAGKSGYSRVLGCAGFMRGDVEVLANINDPDCSELTPMVEIEVKDADGKRPINYIPGQECTELNSFHVFDVKSVQEHLIKKNKFTFSPAGLSYLTTLAEVTDTVRDRLTNLITKNSKPEDYLTYFEGGDSDVKDMIKDLSSKTDLKALKKASVLSKKDEKEIKKLDKKIAGLKTKNIPKKIKDFETKKTDLTSLKESLEDLSGKLTDKATQNIQNKIKEFNAAEAVAKKLGIDHFKTDYFNQTGKEPWNEFTKAAKKLAEKEQTDKEKPYPQEGDRCLLCHQPLTPEARKLIHKLWEFLGGEAQAAVDTAQKSLNNFSKAIGKVTTDFFNDKSVSHRYLTAYDTEKKTEIVSAVETFVGGCKARLESFTKMIKDKNEKVSLDDLPDSGVTQVEAVITHIEDEIKKLEDSDPTEEIKKLEKKLRNLNHKKILGKKYDDIEKYVNKLIWLKAASNAGGSTRPITTKYNELFKKIVTGGYVKSFQDILDSLGRPIRVQVETKPRKGETFRQLQLKTDSDTLPPGANPDSVLSEGEKRAVALADFLTEVDLDTGSGGIVLDDPVTSLDIEWISVIASLLAKEAKDRQVIVFTHNLTFIHSLKNYCSDHSVDIQLHWIKRGDLDDKPGYVYPNNSPVLESDYKTTHKASQHYQKAMKLGPEEQETELKQGFGALRSTYEAFIIFNLLGGVVARWNERISPSRLKDIVWEKDFFQKIIDKHAYLSKYIEAHLHSDEFTPIKPTPELLNQEIQEFTNIKKEHSAMKKTAA